MRRVSFALVAMIVSFVVAAAAPVSAAVLHTTFPVAGTFAHPCTGENIVFAGVLDVVIGESADATGDLEVTMSNNFRAVTGVSVLLGTQYQIPADSSHILSIGAAPVTLDASNDFRVVSAADSFIGRFPLTVTFGLSGINASAGPLQLVCG